ncbi:MAG: hypothetical protein IPK67_18405 [Planctomycetes bacterium]|nr:hypothetical protein [Planctomycetota bacterium]
MIADATNSPHKPTQTLHESGVDAEKMGNRLDFEPVLGLGEPYLLSEIEAQVIELERTAHPGRGAIESPDALGHTLLHKSVNGCSLDLATRLIALGANPNAISGFGFTPLDYLYQGCGGGRDCSGLYALLLSVGARCNWYK